jgi:putative membrane protein
MRPASLLLLVLAVLVWSGIDPRDRFTWFLEVLPVLIVLPLLISTRQRFPFTPLAYHLIAIHAVILLVGGHYTYAEMPLFNWLRDVFELSRNHYDRIGHIAQGFIPAIVAREILLRRSPLVPGKWLFFLVICVCLAISAFSLVSAGFPLVASTHVNEDNEGCRVSSTDRTAPLFCSTESTKSEFRRPSFISGSKMVPKFFA